MATQLSSRPRNNDSETRPRTESSKKQTLPARVSTGVSGLDEVLQGGLVAERAYLLRGGPGCGKTTLGMHFLQAGADRGEPVLFVSLGETESQLRSTGETLGFSLEGVEFLDLTPGSEYFAKTQVYDIFTPAEVEREPTTQRIMEAIERIRPRRVFLDAMTQLRYLSRDSFEFRKQALSFQRFLLERGATLLFTSEASETAPDDDLQFMADGVIHLTATPDGRFVQVEKFRGSGFRGGLHSLRLGKNGMEVFPRLIPMVQTGPRQGGLLSSGIPHLDEMLHGGVERGTITIITGPSGAGKTTMGLQFMKEAAGRGERSVVYLFEEAKETLMTRCEQVNIPAREMVEKGTLSLVQIEPLQFSPDEFGCLIRREVDQNGTRMVMVDSVGGFRLSLRGQELVNSLHAVGKYLSSRGVSLLLINEVEAVTGDFRPTDAGISYLADNILFMRYLEINGELRKAIGVLKKRIGSFEKSMRELEISRYGLKVGKPLTGLRGILRGQPEWVVPPNGSANGSANGACNGTHAGSSNGSGAYEPL